MKKELPPLYTQEVVVFRERVEGANLQYPVTVLTDADGNHLLQHGNHRAKKASMTGEHLERTVIGTTPITAANNPNYRLVSDLKIVEGNR